MNKVKVTAAVQTQQKATTIVKAQNGKLTITKKKEFSIKTILKLATDTNGKCYMLSFNPPDKRKYSTNDIIAELVKNGFITNGGIECALKHSLLFVSSFNLNPIQKFLHNIFPNLKFVLVRLNRQSLPALKYCY